ncbi:hypothetical protein ACJJTC_014734, partial [Scirpophaga incertulas]
HWWGCHLRAGGASSVLFWVSSLVSWFCFEAQKTRLSPCTLSSAAPLGDGRAETRMQQFPKGTTGTWVTRTYQGSAFDKCSVANTADGFLAFCRYTIEIRLNDDSVLSVVHGFHDMWDGCCVQSYHVRPRPACSHSLIKTGAP